MAITAGITNQFKSDILAMAPHTAADTYKIALFPNSATIGPTDATYSSTGECANGNGYTTGGATLVGFTAALYTSTGTLDWTTDPSWVSSTITARGAWIYNSSRTNKAVCVLDFGLDVTSTNGTFTVTFPVAAAGTALIRIA